MRSAKQTARELESVDWEGVQETVRAFRRALDRGERPALETSARGGKEPTGGSDRADPRRDGGSHHGW